MSALRRHGARSSYVAGCHCDDCRDAHSVYEAKRRSTIRAALATAGVPAGSSRGVDQHECRKIVWARLRTGVGQSPYELAVLTGLPHSAVRRALRELVDAGEAETRGATRTGVRCYARTPRRPAG